MVEILFYLGTYVSVTLFLGWLIKKGFNLFL
jgi:hypothetical protein